MTSLLLNAKDGIIRPFVPEWGTNKPKEKVPLWTPKPPTWHLSGEPTEQYYDLTLLKKSNVRANDQLLPNPQNANISEKMIDKPFPSEHPYSSHTARLKVFPSFATTSEDPKRGYNALNSQPISNETPAANYDVLIINKTKGTPERHEVQALPYESMKRGLTWNGDQGFHQGVKVLGDRQPYYPSPPTTVVPNIENHSGTHLEQSDRSANATRNLERQQWKTTYERNHTGIGPVNQYKLDNLDEKRHTKTSTGVDDDELYPWFKNTFEPSRPQEGRIAGKQNPNYGISQLKGAMQENTGYVRKPTLTEREEQRLLNGKEYVSLPEDGTENVNRQWKEWSILNHPEHRFAALVQQQMQNASETLPYIERGTEPLKDEKGSYMEKLAEEHHDNVQQVEASNRWKLLESNTPSKEIGALSRKFKESSDRKEHPATFYGHEPKYNEERTGLYKTSYDPSKLAFKLDDDSMKLNIRNNVNSAQNALHLPTPLNDQMDVLRQGTETDPRKVPMFSERPDVFEVFEPFHRDRHILKQQLKPDVTNARPRIQEGGIVLTDSTMGSAYSTQKFLQEYSLPKNVRSEPLSLMSNQNQNLDNVRINSKQVKFNNQITVGEGAGNSPLLVSKADIESPKVMLHTPRAVIPNSSIQSVHPILSASLPMSMIADKQTNGSMRRSAAPFRRTLSVDDKPNYSESLSDTEKLFLTQKGKTTARNLFESKSSSFGMGAGSFDTFKTTNDSQFARVSQSANSDTRYSWEPGCGMPRPQTSLLKIQNSFSKSDAYKRLQASFSEKTPKLIDNVTDGRQHEFLNGSMNAQVLRGTLVNA